MLGVGAQLSKRLELTSVKKLLRLHKYRSFSFEELTQVTTVTCHDMRSCADGGTDCVLRLVTAILQTQKCK